MVEAWRVNNKERERDNRRESERKREGKVTICLEMQKWRAGDAEVTYTS